MQTTGNCPCLTAVSTVRIVLGQMPSLKTGKEWRIGWYPHIFNWENKVTWHTSGAHMEVSIFLAHSHTVIGKQAMVLTRQFSPGRYL